MDAMARASDRVAVRSELRRRRLQSLAASVLRQRWRGARVPEHTDARVPQLSMREEDEPRTELPNRSVPGHDLVGSVRTGARVHSFRGPSGRNVPTVRARHAGIARVRTVAAVGGSVPARHDVRTAHGRRQLWRARQQHPGRQARLVRVARGRRPRVRRKLHRQQPQPLRPL